ncbi:nucleotidyltransferase domain-containing protein [Marinitenerispora sediminis]|uniref:DNA polymerase subunit beta n=1 Tax=Marinitenerispora sediminis TaxID=1931232 RepID=A0A368T447_9ACTN|nr:nucleotidyltransferase domain-containing protein [Marinitenerispora sediminis]RCV55866.1 DNA polymerase subunit beta [Marinitenerispora sediminis]RCV57329.1 DNA polymerase subunit beta [Marinitenerispora sediminis]RCV59417.1 DNA polymerase subunit beta [Marinitenerispora sediminis]
MAVHPQVRAVAETFLHDVDTEAPGLVEGLYLTGSVALGDYRPHSSDVDFVVVTGHRLTDADRTALRRVHARMRSRFPRPQFNGIHVTWEDLVEDPGACGPVASVIGGRFRDRAGADVNPVTWHVLAEKGVPVRGPLPVELDVWDEREGLRAWSFGSLDEHWRRWRAKAGRLVTPRGLAALGSLAPSWSVLSVSRLHFTLRTGEITSKSGAGFYALHAFPEHWDRIVNECLRIRRDSRLPSLYRSTLERRRAALDYIEMVLDDALRPAPA